MSSQTDRIGAAPSTGFSSTAIAFEAQKALRAGFLALAVLYLILFGVDSLTRSRRFSPDSMNYTSVGRNVLAGRGITQSALGLNQPHFRVDAGIPAPLVSQPPLYPLLIATFSLPGITATDAALIVPVLCYGLILLLGYAIVRSLTGKNSGLLAVALLLLYPPLRMVSSYAWSEALGMTFVLLSFWLLIRKWPNSKASPAVLLAGLCAGLAFATRYALWPAFFVGLLTLLEPRQAGSLTSKCVTGGNGCLKRQWLMRYLPACSTKTMNRLGLYVLGFVVPVMPVLSRNFVLSGALLGPSPNPSTRGLMDNLRDSWWAIVGNYLPINGLTPMNQMMLLALLVFSCCMALAVRHRLSSSIRAVSIDGKSFLLTSWFVVYLVFLIYQRSQIHFDYIGPRLIVPAGIILILLLASLIGKTLKPHSVILLLPALLAGLLAVRLEAAAIVRTPQYDIHKVIASSQRLTWIAENTSDSDLVIGDDTMDIPFYFEGRKVVSFSPYPFTDWPVYGQLDSFVHRHCTDFTHTYLVLRGGTRPAQVWMNMYGPFIADIVSGHTEHYPDVVFRQRLVDGYVFEFKCST